MVLQLVQMRQRAFDLSVLALSSRFDGQIKYLIRVGYSKTFSTRSVESF